jgi:hypothetical protein
VSVGLPPDPSLPLFCWVHNIILHQTMVTVHSSAPASAGAGQGVSWTPLAVALYAWTYHMPSVASNLCNGVDAVQFGIRLAAKQRWLWYVLF